MKGIGLVVSVVACVQACLAESSAVMFSLSSMNAKQSYFFDKPADEVTLSVTYAQGVKTLTLPL